MYEHTQHNSRIFVMVGLFGAAPQVVLMSLRLHAMTNGVRAVLIAGIVIALAAGIIFSSMTIRIDDRNVLWHFGPGVLHKSASLREVVSAEPTTTHWYDGLGVHLTDRGWLYNIGGRQAVLITMQDGRRFLLGTDEPMVLAERVRQHVTIRRPRS